MQKRVVKPGRPIGTTTFKPAAAAAFGSVVRERRKERGLSQEELAHRAGVERSHMGKIERGEHLPNLVMILSIADVLSLKPGKLVDMSVEAMRQEG